MFLFIFPPSGYVIETPCLLELPESVHVLLWGRALASAVLCFCEV